MLLFNDASRLIQERQRDGRRKALQPIEGCVNVVSQRLQRRFVECPPLDQLLQLGQATAGEAQMERWLGPRGRNP